MKKIKLEDLFDFMYYLKASRSGLSDIKRETKPSGLYPIKQEL